MPFKINRTDKDSAKKDILKETDSLHPKSRKHKAIVKQLHKLSKKEKSKQELRFKQSLVADKLLWFQKQLDPCICPYTAELTAELIEKYISRNDEELEQIKIKRSIGVKRNHQHSGREDAICMTKEKEKSDYEGCGLEIPNILNTTQLTMLKKWNGDLKFLPNFKLCRFSKRHLEEELQKQSNKSDKTLLESNLNKTEGIQNKSKKMPIEETKDEMDVE